MNLPYQKVEFVVQREYSRTFKISTRIKRDFKGGAIFQTPWILRALEGLTIHSLWLTQEDMTQRCGYGVQCVNWRTRSDEEILRRRYHHSFEGMWDSRSAFFPEKRAYFIARGVIPDVCKKKNIRSCEYIPGYTFKGITLDSCLKKLIEQVKRDEPFAFVDERSQ